jgi:hypothetical protein
MKLESKERDASAGNPPTLSCSFQKLGWSWEAAAMLLSVYLMCMPMCSCECI